MPELRAINPAVDSSIVRTANLMREEDDFLNGAAAAALEQSEIPLNGELKFLTQDVEMAFHRSHLHHLPPVLFRRAIRLAAKALGSSLDYNQTETVIARIGELSGSVSTEFEAVRVDWNADRYHFRQVRPDIPFRYNLTVPGETFSDEFGWQFTAFEEPAPDIPPRRDALVVHVSLEAVRGNLHFRTAKAGDLMQPLGFSGRRSLADLMGEASLTLAARARLPIVSDMLGILWAPGVCLDERARSEPGKPALRIEFGPIGLGTETG